MSSANIDEIENINLILSNLSLNSNSDTSLSKNSDSNLTNMAPPHFDMKILDIVPKFEGETNELASFLEISTTLIQTYWDATNPTSVQNILLINGIYAKLIGRARSIYCNSISKDWDSVKKALIAHFGDQRNESGLLMDLGNLKQTLNEPSLHFFNRVMNILNALHNYIDLHENSIEIKTVKKRFYQEHSLNILLSGLRDPQGPIIRSMKPKNLAEAQQYITTDNSIRYQQRNNNNGSNNYNSISSSNNNNNNSSSSNGNNFNHKHKPHNNNQTQKFMPYLPSNAPQFSTNPNNTQNRPPMTRQTMPNQTTNVFRPRNNQNFPRPTPMSGISTAVAKPLPPNTPINRNPYQNQFRPPRYNFQELYQIDGQSQAAEYQNSLESYQPGNNDYNYYPENYNFENFECTEQTDQYPEENYQENFQEVPPLEEET